MRPTPLLFVNIGWQVRYEGPKNDPTLGGHGYLLTHKLGHESWTFAPLRGKLYGYIPRETNVRLENLGASAGDSDVTGITVVWLARSPHTGRTVIVGWYKNARVYRQSGMIAKRRTSEIEVQYQIVADEADGHLLALDQRTFVIPTKKEPGCLGQSPVWYGTDEAFRNKVRAFLASNGRVDLQKNAAKAGAGRQHDPEKRRRIEKAAIDIAISYYESVEGGEREVKSVESEGCGWDLEAVRGSECLLVEVKGVGGDICDVELTPNEYAKMRSAEHRDLYVVFVVTGLEAGRPCRHIFRFNKELSSRTRAVWMSPEGERLVIKEVVGARLTARTLVSRPPRSSTKAFRVTRDPKA